MTRHMTRVHEEETLVWLRPYAPEDRPACLAILNGNTPPYFAPHERAQFETFLDTEADPYFVVVDGADQVIACGGYLRLPDSPVAILTWGMVARERHRQGIGWFLLLERLHRMGQDPAIARVRLETSQHTYGFFEKAGFVTTRIVEDGFGPGLHQYEMWLELDEAGRARIEEERAKLARDEVLRYAAAP